MLGPLTRSAAERASHAEQVELKKSGNGDEREPKRSKTRSAASTFRIAIMTMAGAAIAIDDASATDTILSVKERTFAANRKLYVRRQRLVYCAGPRGMDPLPDDDTLGGAGVAQDGTAVLDVLLADLTAEEARTLGAKV